MFCKIILLWNEVKVSSTNFHDWIVESIWKMIKIDENRFYMEILKFLGVIQIEWISNSSKCPQELHKSVYVC